MTNFTITYSGTSTTSDEDKYRVDFDDGRVGTALTPGSLLRPSEEDIARELERERARLGRAFEPLVTSPNGLQLDRMRRPEDG